VRVLLLSAYAAQSHEHWRECLLHMLDDYQWQVLTLPPRHFSWRVRGNPLYWSIAERDALEAEYDVLVATSMVDLATLRGLVPALARLPTLLYFHENQFEYPLSKQVNSAVEAQMVSLYSALAADAIAFNSQFNKQSFLRGVSALLQRLPDHVPTGVVQQIERKSCCLPVPFDDPARPGGASPHGQHRWSPRGAGDSSKDALRLLWVGRFEHDKGGDRLLQILQLLETDGMAYELAVVGQQFRNSPACFAQIQHDFAHRLVAFGYQESYADYHAVLAAADVVLSTALHEFQGLAVLQAVAAGCIPLVPRRQAYPELYPEACCYASFADDPAREARAALASLKSLVDDLGRGSASVPDVSAFSSAELGGRYRDLLEQLAAAQR
tara:strand:- start:138511 stop:139656 length:1146 start_codon:yes stop_codon:yes gene_type:complete